jgi:hypothetical protein
MNKVFITGLLTELAAVVVSYFQANGFPSTGTAWDILGITVVGNLLIYLGKNLVLPSISVFGTIDMRDVLSGLILALGSSFTSLAASAITSTPISWSLIGSTAGSVALAYLATKFGLGTKTTTTATN